MNEIQAFFLKNHAKIDKQGRVIPMFDLEEENLV